MLQDIATILSFGFLRFYQLFRGYYIGSVALPSISAHFGPGPLGPRAKMELPGRCAWQRDTRHIVTPHALQSLNQIKLLGDT